MKSGNLRIPSGVWGWTGTALVVLTVALPPIIALRLDPGDSSLSELAGTASLVAHVVALAGALLLYFRWRLTHIHSTAWLATALMVGSVKGISMAGLRVAYPEAIDAHAPTIMVVDLVVAVAALATVTILRRQRPPIDPAGLGLVLGVFVSGVVSWLVGFDPLLHPGPQLVASGNLLLLALQLGFAWAVLGLDRTPLWATARLSLGLVLLSVNRAISYPTLEGTLLSAAALVADSAGAVLLCGTALATLCSEIRDQTSTVDALQDRVAQVEQTVREDRERWHEINATIAGIATATRVIREGPHDLVSHRKRTLQHLLDSEIARLARLVDHRTADLRDVDLDEIIAPLVEVQRAMGRTVDWAPGGLVACGRGDDIAEVLTTLLTNAAQHAPGAPVAITTRCVDEGVEIKVADRGPGIPGELAARIFERGERGPESQGQGIGLHVAKRLVADLGGSLRVPLSPSHVGIGAVFVISLLPSLNHGSSHGTTHARAR